MSNPDQIQNMFARWTQTCLLFMKIILTSDENHFEFKKPLLGIWRPNQIKLCLLAIDS